MQQSFTSQQNNALTKQRKEDTMANSQKDTSMQDNRPIAITQAKVIEGIQNSPKMLAQRKTKEAIFDNQPAQRALEEEDLMQGKFENQPIQRALEEEDLMQGKFDNSSPSPIQQKAENGLPGDINQKLESTLGMDFSGVNIHTNSDQATQMSALAYAQGNDVHFAPGQFKPNTSEGQKLIGHEFAHVVQQAEGRVKPTAEVNGMPVNDNKGLEGEADKMGEMVARA